MFQWLHADQAPSEQGIVQNDLQTKRNGMRLITLDTANVENILRFQ